MSVLSLKPYFNTNQFGMWRPTELVMALVIVLALLVYYLALNAIDDKAI